jgi:hypothetical protein
MCEHSSAFFAHSSLVIAEDTHEIRVKKRFRLVCRSVAGAD